MGTAAQPDADEVDGGCAESFLQRLPDGPARGGAVHGDIAQPLSARPVLAERDWPSFTARLTALADRMAENGLRLAYHHHMGTRIQTEAEPGPPLKEITSGRRERSSIPLRS